MTFTDHDERAAWLRAYLTCLAAGRGPFKAQDGADAFIVALRAREAPATIHDRIIARTAHIADPIPPVARVKLGAWTDANGSMTRDFVGNDRMCGMGVFIETAGYHWCVWPVGFDDANKCRRAPVAAGREKTMEAAQHAADTSPEARGLYEWEGQTAPTCQHCGHSLPEFFATSSDGTTRHVANTCPTDDMGRPIPPPAPPSDIAARTPTLEDVEAAILAWVNMRRPRPMPLVAWLGWSYGEWTAYDMDGSGEGTIPARPLRKHEVTRDGSRCADCECNHDVGIGKGICGCHGSDGHPWRKRAEAPKPLDREAALLACDAAAAPGSPPSAQRALIALLDGSWSTGSAYQKAVVAESRNHPVLVAEFPPAAPIPRPDAREAAIKALRDCGHSRATVQGRNPQWCPDCGAVFRGAGWALPSLLAALVSP